MVVRSNAGDVEIVDGPLTISTGIAAPSLTALTILGLGADVLFAQEDDDGVWGNAPDVDDFAGDDLSVDATGTYQAYPLDTVVLETPPELTGVQLTDDTAPPATCGPLIVGKFFDQCSFSGGSAACSVCEESTTTHDSAMAQTSTSKRAEGGIRQSVILGQT